MKTQQESLEGAAKEKSVLDALAGNVVSGRGEDLKKVQRESGDEERRAEQEKLVKKERIFVEDNGQIH